MYAHHVTVGPSRCQISCITDVFNGIALMYEPAEDDIMLARPRNVERNRLVTGSLIFYSYGFYGNLQSLAAFVTWCVPTGGIQRVGLQHQSLTLRLNRDSAPTRPTLLRRFYYMASRGPTGLVADPIPATGDPALINAYPVGYTSSQLTFAWNWGA